MTNFDEIFDRIKTATNTRTQVEIAEVLDIRQSSISDAKRRNSVPSDWFMKLFEQFGLNPDWIKKGSGPMYLRTEQGYSPVDAPQGNSVGEDTARYGGADSRSTIVTVNSTLQGADESPGSVPVLGRLNIPQSFFSPGLYVVRIDNAAMEPQILKNAFVGLDSAQRRVSSGELYGVNLPYEGLVLKKVFIDTEGKRLLLRSENPEHPEVSLPLDGYEKFIVGRVAWVLQRF